MHLPLKYEARSDGSERVALHRTTADANLLLRRHGQRRTVQLLAEYAARTSWTEYLALRAQDAVSPPEDHHAAVSAAQ